MWTLSICKDYRYIERGVTIAEFRSISYSNISWVYAMYEFGWNLSNIPFRIVPLEHNWWRGKNLIEHLLYTSIYIIGF